MIAALLGASIASAQEAAPDTVRFSDPAATTAQGPTLDLSVREDAAAPVQQINPVRREGVQGPRRLELALAAGGGDAPVDVSIAQRASLGSDENGEVNRQGSGSELRVGRGLVRDARESSGQQPSVYMFVASDDEALTWQPGARNDFGGRGSSLALEDRVEVGDLSAGVTYERNGVQASLAYVEREQTTRIGTQNFNQDQSFAGLTVTMRR